MIILLVHLSDKLICCKSLVKFNRRSILSIMFDVEITQPLPPRRATLVSDRIAEAIREGELSPGDELPSEKQLSEMFGVSRPVVREAIRELSSMGVVHVQQGKVTRVAALDATALDRFFRLATLGQYESLREANELRRALEPGIAALAAVRRGPEGIAAIRKAVSNMRENIGDPAKFTDADIAFHEAIAQTTGNQLIMLQVKGLRPVISEVSYLFTNRDRPLEAWDATCRRHEAIAEAIASGDATSAEALMRSHFDPAEIALRELQADSS